IAKIPRSDGIAHRNQRHILANIGFADEYQAVVRLNPWMLAAVCQPRDAMFCYVGGIKLEPMSEPAFCLCCVTKFDRGRQIRVIGSRSRLFDPAVIDQQLAFDDLGLARRPGHALDAAMLCQPFASRDHLHLAVAVADWIAAGVEYWLW